MKTWHWVAIATGVGAVGTAVYLAKQKMPIISTKDLELEPIDMACAMPTGAAGSILLEEDVDAVGSSLEDIRSELVAMWDLIPALAAEDRAMLQLANVSSKDRHRNLLANAREGVVLAISNMMDAVEFGECSLLLTMRSDIGDALRRHAQHRNFLRKDAANSDAVTKWSHKRNTIIYLWDILNPMERSVAILG